jgi:hypothetical protein
MIAKVRNTKLAVSLARDSNYKVQKNGVIKKKGADGKFRTVGSERHGYQVVNYRGVRVVVGRVVRALRLLDFGYSSERTTELLLNNRVFRKNGVSLDDSYSNVRFGRTKLTRKAKTLSRTQIDKMVALFCEGYSVAKIARRFRRKISRSHLSRIIKRELGVTA